MDIAMTKQADSNSTKTILWRKDGGDEIAGKGPIYNFLNPVGPEDEGIYEIYYNGERNLSRGSLHRLIVRGTVNYFSKLKVKPL